MIPVFNNILYYLNLAALLQHQHDNGIGNNALAEVLPAVFVKQNPPGPISPGEVVKFVCALNDTSISGEAQSEISYEWKLYKTAGDIDGKSNSMSVIGLNGHDADLEMKFNESFVDPQTRFHIVCKIRSKKSRSRSQTSEPINLIFSLKDSPTPPPLQPPPPPSNFKILDITSRAAYFSWFPPRMMLRLPPADRDYPNDAPVPQPEITGYIIEFKNSKGFSNWQSDKVSRYEIGDGNTFAACISDLSPWTTYHFRISSISNNVTSSPSLPIIVRTAEDVPAESPVQIKVEAIEEKTLLVSWKPPPKRTWNGSILGYNIGTKKASSDDDEAYVIHIVHPFETVGNFYSYRIKVADSTVPYKVVVRVFNNIGSGPFSQPVTQTQRHAEGE